MTRRIRRAHRVPVHLDVDLIAEGDAHRHQGTAVDISIGGLFIETTTALPLASTLSVRLRLPGIGREVELPAVVRWTARHGVGVQLKMLGARETHAITEIMRAARAKQRAGGGAAA
jgi:hypothetical protein